LSPQGELLHTVMPLMVLYFSVAWQSQMFWTHFLCSQHVYYFVTLKLQLTVICFERTYIRYVVGQVFIFLGCCYNCWNRLYNNDVTVVLQYSSIYYELAASICFEHYLLIFRSCCTNNW
jgi:hypothetical protein